jgi:aryl-alcohol dehydrogenase-like predicted oxidoreductase
MRILAALDAVASRHSAKPAEIALAWVARQEGVTAPIASATSIAQLDSLTKSASLKLSDDAVTLLDKVGA